MLQTGICRFLSLFLTCILLASLYSCSTSKKASPNAIIDVEHSELKYDIIQKIDEELIEFLIFFSEEKRYDQFQNELRSLNLLVPTRIKEITYLEGQEAVNTYGEEVNNGVMIVKSENSFEQFFKTLEIFGIPLNSKLFESNSLYFEDNPPILIGGLQGLQSRTIYPEEARKDAIQGTVVVSFTVTNEGKIIGIKIVRNAHRSLNREARRVIKESKFIPGIKGGKPVIAKYTIPVNFRLYK